MKAWGPFNWRLFRASTPIFFFFALHCSRYSWPIFQVSQRHRSFIWPWASFHWPASVALLDHPACSYCLPYFCGSLLSRSPECLHQAALNPACRFPGSSACFEIVRVFEPLRQCLPQHASTNSHHQSWAVLEDILAPRLYHHLSPICSNFNDSRPLCLLPNPP